MAISETVAPPDAVSPLVSIIIPAYNRPETLREAIASALLGGHDHLEIIVVDDESPVPIAGAIADLIESNTVHHHRQKNGGMGAARNTGASLAHGEYLLFLDDDDLVVPGSIARRVSELVRRPELSCVFGRSRQFTDLTTGFEPDRALPVERVDRWTNMFCCQVMSPGQALIRTSEFRALGGFATDCPGADDWDLWIRLSARGQMWRMDDFTLSYRMHGGNFSNRLLIMAAGASQVARRSRRLACWKHRSTASYLTRTYVRSLYDEKIRIAAQALAARGAVGSVVRYSASRLVLYLRALWARIEFKCAMIALTHRWSVADAPNQLNGRHCPACERIR